MLHAMWAARTHRRHNREETQDLGERHLGRGVAQCDAHNVADEE